jgi:hypothetical protein
MSEMKGVRWGWLKAMYIITIIVAGGFGLGMILAPSTLQSMFDNVCDPVTYGINGSVFLAFGLLAILGLRDPLKFAPILLLQLVYKTLWFIGVVLPLLVTGRFPASEILTVVIFALVIVGDVIAIPFAYVLAKKAAA